MPDHYSITVTDKPDPAETQFVEDGMLAYNLQYAPPYNHQRLAVFLYADDGTLCGGALGHTWWGWLRIDMVWLNEALRGQGWGTHLMQAAEGEAIRRGCHHAFLDTMSFQALPFYLRLGYEVFAHLDDLPTGHQMYFMKKALPAQL